MSSPVSPSQTPEKSILDEFNRQTYLGNQFIYCINTVSIGSTSETPILLLANPITSNISLFHNLRKLVSLTTGQTGVFRFYQTPTITNPGTPVTPINLRSGSTTVSQAAVSTNPTGSSFGSFIAVLSSPPFTMAESGALSIIDPGTSLLVTVQVSQAATTVAAEIIWYEI